MKKSKGFTLIEAMIVLAIVGILAAIVAPHFSSKAVADSENETARPVQNITQQ